MEFLNHHILTILIFFPLAGAFLIVALPRDKGTLIKTLGLGIALVEAGLSLHLVWHFQDTGLPEFGYGLGSADVTAWISAWNVYYRVGIDGVSLLLVLMATIVVPLALLGTWNSVEKNLKLYLISLLVLEAGMVGVFCALDLFLFYVFWEVMLVPMYFLIGVWGGEDRVYAALKFFIYTMAGSVLMLVGILYLYHKSGSFYLYEIYKVNLSFNEQLWLFAAFALAFAVKVPLLPLHTWLPDAHVQAPTAGSVILAAVLLKMGVYGFFRFCIPLFPQAVQFESLQIALMTLATVGVVYGALVAMVQPDIKKLIAYSSVSHMGVVMLGVFSLNPTAMSGGLLQMVNHGVSTGGLFLLVGMIYDRTHTREIARYSGLARFMPVYAVFFLVITFSSIGVPLTNGFVGEFLTLMGSYQTHKTLTVVAASGVILSAVYMLWLVERVFFGAVKEIHGAERDLNLREVAVLGVLVVFVFWGGIFPRSFLDKIVTSANTSLVIMESRLGGGQ